MCSLSSLVVRCCVGSPPRVLIENILSLRREYLRFLDGSFKNDRTFHKVFKESIEYFINLDCKVAQYLSLYTDDLLRKQTQNKATTSTAANSNSISTTASTGGNLSDFEFDNKLNEIIDLFRYIHERDIFEDYYKQHLSKRLLESSSAFTCSSSLTSDIERQMISKLKSECGHQFTSRLEGMFRDIDLSKQMNQQWSEGEHTAGGCELAVAVLTTGFWPLTNGQQCVLPEEVNTHTHTQKQPQRMISLLMTVAASLCVVRLWLRRKVSNVSIYLSTAVVN